MDLMDIDALLEAAREEPSDRELVLQVGNEFCAYVLSCYPDKVAKRARDRKKSCAVIRWSETEIPFEISANFASTPPEPPDEHSNDPAPHSILHPEMLLSDPRSKDEEIIWQVMSSRKPTGVMSIASGQVLYMNLAMPEFVGRPLDQIAVPDVYELFKARDRFVPDDPTEFHEILINSGRGNWIEASLKAFRTSGAFGSYHGRYKYELIAGVPVRISEYERFELIL